MGVLRKKIDGAAAAKPLDVEEAELCWQGFQQEMLEALETLIEPLMWKSNGLSVKQLDPKTLIKSFPKNGLFVTWGETDRETQNLILLNIKLAGLVSRFGFQGEITDLKKLDKHPISKFDIMLLEDILRQASAMLNPDTSIVRKDYTEFSEVPFAPDCLNWVRLDFNYSVSLGPKSEALDLSFTMLISQADFDAHIKRGPKIDIVSETLDFDETAETLTRHIDKSITSLRAVLESCEMTVADCTRLSIGQIIPLPGVSLQALSIEAELKDNRICIARGAMGIHKTRRAVQLVEDISPSFIDEGLASVLD